jgi:triacylglycerol esterase/lipase EstA (alpha/beta hydrolase family)
MPSSHRRNWLRRAGLAAVATSAVALALASVLVAPARAATRLPVNWDFTAGATATALTPDTPPPGADNWSCQPTAAHPDPVILVNGTFANMDDNWQAASPLLADNGYCVYAFNYGGTSPTSPIQGIGDIATSAGQLGTFVVAVLAATGASRVDLVGHSQGGMMPRYYLNFLGGAGKVNDFVALAPSNYGTTLDGLTEFASLLGVSSEINGPLSSVCEACVQQEQGSAFLANLNATPTVAGVHYTVIESVDDEVVTPYTNAFLPAASNVTNIRVQNQCLLDGSDHLEIAADPIALADVLNALDPSSPVRVPCQVVLALTGPIAPVPSF